MEAAIMLRQDLDVMAGGTLTRCHILAASE